MRLLQITTRYYLAFSALLLSLAAVSIFLIFTSVMREETEEKLWLALERAVHTLEAGNPIIQQPPILEIEVLDTLPAVEPVYRDAFIHDPFEGDQELFKELVAVRMVGELPMRITVRQVILEPHDYLGTIGLPLAVVLILLLAGIVFINRQISRMLWKPFNENLARLKSFSLAEDHPLDLQSSPITEFGELNGVLVRMSERIRKDYRILKEFTGIAAHEIQNPIAVIRANLDEAQQYPELPEPVMRSLSQAGSATSRLTRLNRMLLFLTRIENQQGFNPESLSLRTHLEQILDELADRITEKAMILTVDLETDLVLDVNPELLDSTLRNLLDNAVKHSSPGSRLEIRMKVRTLTIGNTAPPLEKPPEDLFNRFVKADPASQSLGLGLAIVRAICDRNGWSINYSAVDTWHQLTIGF